MKLSVLDQAPVATGMSGAQALANSVDLAKLSDTLGFHRFWIAEHHGMAAIASPAPEILLARIGAETHGIRIGSGGIMLPHYAPLKVVEQFAMLEALYPGRLDMGLGRAPGGTQLEALALMRTRDQGHQVDDFPQQLAEVRAFLNNSFPRDHLFSRIKLAPALETIPDVWLLGSSLWSANAAAQLSLPFAFAHFFSGQGTRQAFNIYQQKYQPSAEAPAPYSMAAIGVVCADTDEEAERLASSWTALFQRIRRGVVTPVPPPEEAMAELARSGAPSLDVGVEWPQHIRGTPDKVKKQLEEIAIALSLDEVMAVTIVYDHSARRRSYEMLADAFGLTPRA